MGREVGDYGLADKRSWPPAATRPYFQNNRHSGPLAGTTKHEDAIQYETVAVTAGL